MTRTRLTTYLLSLLFMVSTNINAEQAGKNKQSEAKDTTSKNSLAKVNNNNSGSGIKFIYNPPKRGAPAARIGGGTRGIGSQAVELIVIAPDHTGLTVSEQPTLYFYVSEPVLSNLELTMINDDNIEPALEKVITRPGSAGIQSIDLAQTNTRLAVGKEYRWFVSVVSENKERSNDVVASGTIMRIETAPELSEVLTKASENELARIYVENGIWYDAIDSMSKLIKKSPDNSELVEQRAALLEQVGLESAANYARKH